MSMNLRAKQTDAIYYMLNQTSASGTIGGSFAGNSDGGDSTFKVLVLDRDTRDIIGPLVTLQELRRCGVTLHLQLESKRECIDNAPAVYFIKPTEDAVRRVASDANAGLYGSLHINFCQPVQREILETFANEIVNGRSSQNGNSGQDNAGAGAARVYSVSDQYLSFAAISKNVFTLLQPNAYSTLNATSTSDTQIETTISDVVNGLFSALVTLCCVPIIKAQGGGPAEMVARQLDEKIREQLQSRTNLFTQSNVSILAVNSRPYLFIFDRNIDLAVSLQHGWNYQPLVHDLLGLKSNRVNVSSSQSSSVEKKSDGSSPPDKKTYDLGDDDFFWLSNGSSPFPKVAEEVETQLKKYKVDMDEINRKTALSNDINDDGVGTNTKNLQNAVNSLPELTARKRVIDKHTNIATALLAIIKLRGIDSYNNLEDEMLTNKADINSMMQLLGDKSKGNPSDKLRLAIIYILAHESSPSSSEIDVIEAALKELGADPAALHNVRRIKSLNRQNFRQGNSGVGGQANILDWADKLYGQGVSAVTKGMKSLLSGGRELPVTKMVEAIMDGKQTNDSDGIITLDPKQEGHIANAAASTATQAGMRQDAIVFMVGGGNFIEQQSLEMYGKRATPQRNILYGSTDIVNGPDFLEQLQALSR